MTTTAPPAREQTTDSAWLAAFALGLAYAQRPRAELVTELRDAVASQPQLLHAATTRLRHTDVADPDIRHKALDLLNLAAATSFTGTRTSTGDCRPRGCSV